MPLNKIDTKPLQSLLFSMCFIRHFKKGISLDPIFWIKTITETKMSPWYVAQN